MVSISIHLRLTELSYQQRQALRLTVYRQATMKEQAANQRPRSKFKRSPYNRIAKFRYTINGQTKNLKEWCDIYKVQYPTTVYRIKTKGMSAEEALTAPPLPRGGPYPDAKK